MGLFAVPLGTFVGLAPVAVAVGDVDGDSHLDLVTANRDGHGVSIMRGFGDGAFQFPFQLLVGHSPNTVRILDINGDSLPDIATASDDGSVMVLIGTGGGNFQPATPLNLGVAVSPGALATTDLNGDGDPDFVTADPVVKNIAIVLSDGGGAYVTPTVIGVPDTPRKVAIGDVNGDGVRDLLVAADLDASAQQAVVLVLAGNGDGTFGAPARYTAATPGVSATSLAMHDFDGDGRLDVALATSRSGAAGGGGPVG